MIIVWGECLLQEQQTHFSIQTHIWALKLVRKKFANVNFSKPHVHGKNIFLKNLSVANHYECTANLMCLLSNYRNCSG